MVGMQVGTHDTSISSGVSPKACKLPIHGHFFIWNWGHGRSLRVFQRDMVPDDLIGTVLFLASPDSDFMTGQMINIDGGRLHY